ncbi:MAG: F0F1 ATP synthase subunit A [Verrucomicrobia bacterium]|nr:F0F1 ATP synthase subunit A [Verrucomicrobiota bacterium]
MELAKKISLCLLLAVWPLTGLLAQATPAPPPASEAVLQEAPPESVGQSVPETKEEGLPSSATEIFHIGKFPVTNSMLVTWIVAVGIIIFAQLATRNMKSVPDGAQNFWEWIVESLYEFLEGIVGPELVKKTFWFFATIFIFILFTNWFGLIPGVGTIGWGVERAHGFELTRPWLRGGNADLNMTFAMAAIFMVLWLIWALRSNGIWGFTLHLFGPKGDNTGFIKYLMIVVFFAVGFLEVLSIGFRPISLSFRLYGNIFAGENLLEALSNTIQHPAWAKAVFSALLPVPFYFLEILVGLVQAFVFMLLTTVFTALICTHEEAHAKEHH